MVYLGHAALCCPWQLTIVSAAKLCYGPYPIPALCRHYLVASLLVSSYQNAQKPYFAVKVNANNNNNNKCTSTLCRDGIVIVHSQYTFLHSSLKNCSQNSTLDRELLNPLWTLSPFSYLNAPGDHLMKCYIQCYIACRHFAHAHWKFTTKQNTLSINRCSYSLQYRILAS